MKNASVVVLDSWPVMAWLRDEPAAGRVERYFESALQGKAELWMSWMNVGEVYYLFAKRVTLGRAERFLRQLPDLPIRLHHPSVDDILQAARLKGTHRISYGDSFAAALTIQKEAMLATGDPEFLALQDLFPIDWLGT